MKKIVINIGTPCGLNPQNLHIIRDSIFKQPLLGDFFEVRWHVSMDKLVCKKSAIESSLFDDMYSYLSIFVHIYLKRHVISRY